MVPSDPRVRRVLRTVFATYLIALALVVFLPAREAGTVTGFVGIIAGWLAFLGLPFGPAATAVEFVANIVLFVPFGALVRILWPKASSWQRMLPLAAGASAFIELVQLLIPGRVTSLSDVVANTLGAVAAALAAGVIMARFRLRRLRRLPPEPPCLPHRLDL